VGQQLLVQDFQFSTIRLKESFQASIQSFPLDRVRLKVEMATVISSEFIGMSRSSCVSETTKLAL
jgi:hypothetical protein